MADLVVLSEGDHVPADMMLTDATNLSLDESLLTGESVPVDKLAGGNDELLNLVYSGTLVVRGHGTARVLHTGMNTRFGRIGMSLGSIKQEDTCLQQEMKVLVRRLLWGGILISIAIVPAFYFTRGNFIQSLLGGLAASRAILPEEFPVVLSFFLAQGSWKLSKE